MRILEPATTTILFVEHIRISSEWAIRSSRSGVLGLIRDKETAIQIATALVCQHPGEYEICVEDEEGARMILPVDDPGDEPEERFCWNVETRAIPRPHDLLPLGIGMVVFAVALIIYLVTR